MKINLFFISFSANGWYTVFTHNTLLPPLHFINIAGGNNVMQTFTQKHISWLLTLCVVFLLFNGLCLPQADAATSTWDGTSIDTSFSGFGISSDPYLITSAAELAGLSSLSQSNHFTDIYFRLTVDIDLGTGNTWVPIGSYNYGFQGHFDGQYHTISNLTIGGPGNYLPSGTMPATNPVGLFSVVHGGTVENVYLKNVCIYSNGAFVAGIAGKIVSNTSTNTPAIMRNCYVSGNISTSITLGAFRYIGGLSANTYGDMNNTSNYVRIENCCSTVNVSVEDPLNTAMSTYAAGLVGYTQYTNMKNCYATGNVISNKPGYAAIAVGYTTSTDFSPIYGNADASLSILGVAVTPFVIGTSSSSYTGTVTSLSSDYMKSNNFVSLLNSNLSGSTWVIASDVNDGYPVPFLAPQISLSPSTDKTFTTQAMGYAAQTPYSVSVSNPGTLATDTLNITLGGTNAASFTLSKTSLPAIAGGGSDSFTVVPNTGLSEGTYTATVTVSGSNVESKSFNVSFTVFTPTYTITADPTSLDYGEQPQGFVPTAKTVVIHNTGNSSIVISKPTSTSFDITTESLNGSIAAGGQMTFSITPNSGLPAGTYDTTLTFTTDHSTSADVAVTLSVVTPTYTVEADPETLDFGSVIEVYTQPAAQTVTLENTGNSNITIIRPTSTAFDITPPVDITAIPGGKPTYNIQPKAGLPAGVYDETLTFTTNQSTSDSVDVKFTVIAAVYQISVTPTAKDFGSQTVWYPPVDAITVTVTNIGNKTITLTQPTAIAYTLGALSQSVIDPLGTATFTLKPADVLPVGTYTETIAVTGSQDTTASVAASFVVDPFVYAISGDTLYCHRTANGLVLTASGEFTRFTGVTVDGTLINPANYSAKAGSTVVTLYPKYLDTLTADTHLFRILFTDGYAEMEVSIVDPVMPVTGDSGHWTLYLAMALVSLGALLTLRRVRLYGKR